ncbi:MAG: penicillin-binding protein 1A [Myxococcota bacterium]
MTPRWRRWLTISALVVAGLGLVGLIGLLGLLWYYGRDLPPVDALRSYEPPQTTRVVDRDGESIGEIFTERRTVVPMDRIPRELVISVLAAEDADFYQHRGLDYPGILRALARDVLAGRAAQGASTITQQVVKLMLLTPERTVERKIRELILARRLEQNLGKDQILHLYLNHINFGHGRYGVQEAARYYFGKDVRDLTLAEATLIAGAPQAPGRLSPRSHPEAARRRQRYVLDQLERKRDRYWPDLTLEQIEEARTAVVRLNPPPEVTNEAPGIVMLARRALREQLGDDQFERGGHTVHTTVDLDLQKSAQTAVQEGLEAIDGRHGYRLPLEAPKKEADPQKVDSLRVGGIYEAQVTGVDAERERILFDVGGHPAYVDLADVDRYDPDDLSPEEAAETGATAHVSILRTAEPAEPEARAEARLELGPQGAAVVIDPRSRDVLALVGGYEAAAGFNRAVRAIRQPGSTFKPIVYALGIERRVFTPASIVIDAPAVYDEWKPKNYETWRHEGAVRLRVGLAKSINLVAVRVIDKVGAKAVAGFAERLGITTELEPDLGLALGASDVRPIELVNAYATFAAGGRWAPYRIIDRIETRDGQVVRPPAPEEPRKPLSSGAAYVITSMLRSVVEEGTAKAARKLDRPVAGKTGTSNRARDAWFVGYSPNVVGGVWVGFDDRRPLGRRESGGRSALPIWMDLIRAAEEGRPVLGFPMPSGVTSTDIDPATGFLAYEGQEDAIEEVFLEGTVPSTTARPPDEVDPESFLMEQLGGGGQP